MNARSEKLRQEWDEEEKRDRERDAQNALSMIVFVCDKCEREWAGETIGYPPADIHPQDDVFDGLESIIKSLKVTELTQSEYQTTIYQIFRAVEGREQS